MGKLTVQLDKVTNLIDRDLFGKSDPFVEFHLETDNFGPFDNSHGKKYVREMDKMVYWILQL